MTEKRVYIDPASPDGDYSVKVTVKIANGKMLVSDIKIVDQKTCVSLPQKR